MEKIIINYLIDWCKDYYKYFGCFPMEFATFKDKGEEDIIYKYPDYLEFLSDSQIREIVYHRP